MRTFADLPPELIVIVSQYLFPSDFSNLRLVSRSIKHKAEAFVDEYRELQVRYSSHTNHGIWNADHYGWGSLAGLLRDLIRSPCHAPYVQRLSLYRWYTTWSRNWYHGGYVVESAQKESERRKDTQELLDCTLTEAVKGCLCFPDQRQFDHWVKEGCLGNQTPILAMLVMKLPCLSTLHLTRIDHFDILFNNAILCVAKAPKSGLLSRLTMVSVSLKDDRAGICLITAFATLPSMRTIHAESLGTGDDYNNRQARELMPTRSRVTELSLRYTGAQNSLLLNLLNCCHDLKGFEFLVDPSNRRCQLYQYHALSTQRPPYNGFGKSTWATSVERILLQDYNPVVHHYKDFFRFFHSLREVDIEFRIIYTSHNAEVLFYYEVLSTCMMAVLPVTVEKVILRYTDEQHEEDFGAVVDEVCWADGFHKLERLPYLRHIHLQALEAPIPSVSANEEPEEFRGNCFPIVENNPCFLYWGVQRCLRIGVTLTSDI